MWRFTRRTAQDVYGWHSVMVQSMWLCTCSQARRPAQSRVSLFRACCFGIEAACCTVFPATAIYASDDSYTCRPCFSRIEKIIKLRKTAKDIEQEVMVSLKHAAYLYSRWRCQTLRYMQVRELCVDDRGSRCIGKCLQQAARRTCTFLPSVRH